MAETSVDISLAASTAMRQHVEDGSEAARRGRSQPGSRWVREAALGFGLIVSATSTAWKRLFDTGIGPPVNEVAHEAERSGASPRSSRRTRAPRPGAPRPRRTGRLASDHPLRAPQYTHLRALDIDLDHVGKREVRLGAPSSSIVHGLARRRGPGSHPASADLTASPRLDSLVRWVELGDPGLASRRPRLRRGWRSRTRSSSALRFRVALADSQATARTPPRARPGPRAGQRGAREKPMFAPTS